MRLKSILAVAIVSLIFIGMLPELGTIPKVNALAERVTTPSTAPYSMFVRDGVLYLFGINSHLYRSTDGGVTYTELHYFGSGYYPRTSGEGLYVTKNDTIIVSVMLSGGATDYLYRSGDHGTTWTLVKTNQTSFRHMTEDELGNLYLGTYGEGTSAPSCEHPWVYESKDNGVTWNIVYNQTAGGWRHIHDMTFDGTNVWVLVGEHYPTPHAYSELAYSSDHGSTWTTIFEPGTMGTIAVTPTQVILGNDLGYSWILTYPRSSFPPSETTNSTVRPTIRPDASAVVNYLDSSAYLSGPPVYFTSTSSSSTGGTVGVYRYDGTVLTPIMAGTVSTNTNGYVEISKEQIGGYYFVLFDNGGISKYLYMFTDPGYQSVTQPIILPVGARTGTLSGCNVTPTTILGDGSSHSVSADPSCLLTVTIRWRHYRYGSGASTWQFYTCASGICSSQTNRWYSNAALLLIVGSIFIVGVAALCYTNTKRKRWI